MSLLLKKKFWVPIPLILGIFLLAFISESCRQDITSEPNLSSSRNFIPEKVDFTFHVKPILSDRCFKCHGPDEAKIEGDLQLHTKEKAFAALGQHKDRFAIKPGDISQSEIINRIYSEDPNDVMPPPESNLNLDEFEKEILKRWVEQGAEWKEHWAFIPPKNSKIPEVQNEEWASNDIDRFILHKLHQQGLSPSNPLTSEKLLRKLSFDLRGLPPSLEDIKAFKADNSYSNYLAYIDKYLDSYAFAERMTNEWLDLSRYADTHGYQDDLERIMWPWRDWVIHAFKKNMPYDEFVTWQLAGDLLPNPTKEQIIATAFNRNHKITQEGGVIPEEYRVEYVSDRTNTFATAFLGLTFECAKCHDHKYDPISQKEYFQLFSYFNSIDEVGLIEEYGAIPDPYIIITNQDIKSELPFINNRDTMDSIPLMVMKELKQPRQAHILNRGLYDQPTSKVFSKSPAFGTEYDEDTDKNQTRLELADWLFRKDNPLTARVTVNRLWQQFFGRGIVATSFDFGNQGALPSHPELLDHLALKLQDEEWDLRNLIKYMVSSSTYIQDHKIESIHEEIDPENVLLARSTRNRLSAEMIRDHALSISGLLIDEIGGPSVKPYQPDGLWSEVTGGGGGSTAKYIQDEGADNYRRSLYTFWKRTVPPPNMMLFDTPTRDFCMVKRENTSTPLQALVLLNDPQFLEIAQSLAFKAINENSDPREAIQQMFTLATSRSAEEKELSALLDLYKEQKQFFDSNKIETEKILKLKKFNLSSETIKAELAAQTFVANAILNLDETIRKT